MTEPEIREISPIRMIGKKIHTSLSTNDSVELWRQFMARHREITGRKGEEYYGVQIFPPGFTAEQRHTLFERWAAVPVNAQAIPPEGLEVFNLKGGTYAVFLHRGIAAEFPKTMQHIFAAWLPASGFQLDNRPQITCMDERYKGHENPDTEEEIWIPVRKK